MDITIFLHKDLHNPSHPFYRKGQTCAWGIIVLSVLLIPYALYLTTIYHQATAKNFFALYGVILAWISLVSLKFTPQVNTVLGIMLTITVFTTAKSINHTGGIYSVGLLWYLSFIVFTFLFVSERWGFFISFFIFCIVAFFYYSEINGLAPEYRAYILRQKSPIHNLFTFVFLMISTCLLVYNFRKVLNKTNRELDELQQQKITELATLVKQRTDELTRLRSELARDFHDEMGNKLASISILSQTVQYKLKNNEQLESEEMLETIERRSLELYQGTKDFIWSMGLKSDLTFEFFIYTREFAEVFFNELDIDFETHTNIDFDSNLRLTPNANRQLVYITKEIFTNAAKHAQCSLVTFSVEKKENRLEIIVTDNGVGFDTSLKTERGLANIERRVQKINGNLALESNIEKGTQFIITLMLDLV